MDHTKILTTVEEIRVFSDPYRLEIFSTFKQFNKPATVKQISVKMNEVPAKVHYHVKKMEKVGIVKLVYTEEINGIIAKYYEPAAKFFRIEKAQLAPEWMDEILNEGKQVYQTIYDRNKAIFLKNIDSKAASGMLSANTIYLTDDEAEKLEQQLQDVLTQYEDTHLEDKKPYELFCSLIRLTNTESTEDNKD